MLSHMNMNFHADGVAMKPLVIKEDAMAPIGLDEYAWNAFRGVEVDEAGNIEMESYHQAFDADAIEVFVLMLAGRIQSGRLEISFHDMDGQKFGFFIEKDAAVMFGKEWTDIWKPLAPKGKELMQKVIGEAIQYYRQRIERMMELDETISEEIAA